MYFIDSHIQRFKNLRNYMDTRIENWSNSTIARKLYEYLKTVHLVSLDFIHCIYNLPSPFSTYNSSGLLLLRHMLLPFMPNDRPYCGVCNYCNKPSVLPCTHQWRRSIQKKQTLWWLMPTLRCSHLKKLPNHESPFSAWGPSPPFSSHVRSLFSVIDCFMSDIKSNAWSMKRIMGRFD